MSRDDDEESTSFDPRTWIDPKPRRIDEATRAPGHGGGGSGSDSFDPRSWAGATSRSPGAATAGSGPTVADPAPMRTAATAGEAPRPPYVAALGAGAIMLLAGAAVVGAMRVAPSQAIAAAAPIDADAPTLSPGGPVMADAGAIARPTVPEVEASRRTLVVAGVGELGPTLASAGLPPPQVRAAVGAAAFALGHAPGELRLVFDLVGDPPAQRLTRLAATREDGAGVTLTAQPDGSYASEVVQARLTTQVKVVRGEMDETSFYNAAVNAGVTDSLVSPFANAFSFDVDFQREVRPGDVFEAAFEQKVNPSGDPVGPPSLIYVSLQTADKSKALYHFLAPGDTEPGWYDGNGKSTVRALMRTPVDGARISSSFGMRVHPVLGFMKLHKGIDFAAPIGTPIYAAGDGVVQWAAMKGPNGNLTVIRHDNGWLTFYLHQSMFMPGIVPGARVHQGQQIGAIGTTGRSTGPHLHYQVEINGQPVDPAGIDTGTGKALSGGALAAFKKERDRIDAARAQSQG